MKERFLQEAIKSLHITGAVAPSSKHLEKKMLKPINFRDAEIIVEFGAGTGVFTKSILNRISPHTSLVSYEINENFYNQLKHIKDKRLWLINDCVAKLPAFMEEYEINEVDYIVSGLPLAIFDKTFVNEVLRTAYNSLKPGGKYIQYQYSVKSFRTLKRFFNDVKLDFTPINIPPAFVYYCTKEAV